MTNLNSASVEYDEKDPRKLKIAKTISTFTNPPILCIPLFLIICIVLASNGTPFTPSFSFDWGLFAICEIISLVFASALPMAIIVFWAKKLNTDSDISNREDRFAPLIIGTASYFIGFILSWLLNLPSFLTVLLLCYTTNTFIVMLITTKWKISIHTTGLSGPVAALIMLLGPIGALFGLLYPVLIWSRVTLKKHTMAQAISGGVLGFILTVVETFLFLSLFGLKVNNIVPLKECLWIIFAIVACPIVLGLLGLAKKRGFESLILRKTFHLFAFLGFAIFYFYAPFSATTILILTGIVSILITIYAGESFSWHKAISRGLNQEKMSILISLICGVAWTIIGISLFTVEATVISSLIIGFVGAIAEPVSIMFANHKFEMDSLLKNKGNKSIEGSIIALIITMIILLLFTQNLFVSIAVGLAVCLIETFLPKELENLIIPLVAAAILGFLLHY